jgi:RNA polymerase sigma-70 factor (ECF subfamily)
MSETESEFRALMDRVFAGSQEAAEELIGAYGPHLLREVRRKLNKKLRPKFDSVDFLQEVWASFFAHLPRARRLAGPQDLGAFLIRLARNKVIDAVRQRLEGQKYNVNREQPLYDSKADRRETFIAPQPTPSALAISREEWDRLLQEQPLVYREILVRLRDGKSFTQIAREVAVSVQTVRRVVRRVLPGLVS